MALLSEEPWNGASTSRSMIAFFLSIQTALTV